ncbi:sulfatase-like hydrolase/transferase [Nocardia sp. NEAU-G5]|uniref:Sulfatase-like hydrolase/transferase n=1 Tax=Nocardia albiluteola TaxID=2842303 RepID=A0ABS6B1W8_9NOCA|nr:sulfatase [Nocardia albiluteola]MBU3064287.1 sulfatase-like hydrolase/transferase [Nocardia albiluteola]
MPLDRPNILWIVSEDCPPRFGCYGDPLAATPNLDRLAGDGVVFDHAFSVAPVCAPSRFAMLTGLRPESHAPANHMRAAAPMPSWLRTYPEIMRDQGYYCTNNAKTDYNAAVDPDAIWAESSSTAHWRDRAPGAPFLAVFNFDGTHESSVFMPTEPGVDPARVRVPAYLPGTPEIRGDIARYYDRIAAMDAYVGTLLAQLDEDGLTDSTIVIHTSDHGGVNPRSKRFCYDEGLRVPLIVKAPARYAGLFPTPGTRVAAAVTTDRIPATLLELAGAPLPDHMRGKSLARTAFGPDPTYAFGGRNRMDERYDVIRTVRDQRFRYIRNYHPHRPWGQHQPYAWLAAGYQSWETEHLAGRLDEIQSVFWNPKPGVELYDLDTDPDEVHNLAGDPAYTEVERRLAVALREHTLAVHDNGFLPEDSPDEGYDASRVPGAYPLDRVLNVADAVADRTPGDSPLFAAALADPDATVRRWAAIGVLAAGAPDEAVSARLTGIVAAETDPFVLIPCLETLARYAGDKDAVARLTEYIDAAQPRPVRLEALAALTALPDAQLLPHHQAIADAAAGLGGYVSGAARYLLARLDDTYTPNLVLFSFPPETIAQAAKFSPEAAQMMARFQLSGAPAPTGSRGEQ